MSGERWFRWLLTGAIAVAVPLGARALTADEEVSIQGHRGLVSALALSPDGARLVSAGRFGEAKVWDVKSGQCLATLQAHAGVVTAMAVSPNGKALVTAGADGAVRVWSIASFQNLYSFRPPKRSDPISELDEKLGIQPGVARAGAYAVAFSADTRRLVSGHGDGSSVAWDLTGQSPFVRYGGVFGKLDAPATPVLAAAITPNGRLAAAGTQERAMKDPVSGGLKYYTGIYLWNTTTGESVRFLETDRSVLFLGFLTGGEELVSVSAVGAIQVWDVREGKTLRSFEHGGAIRSAVLSADGTRLATCGSESILVWDVAVGNSVAINAPVADDVIGAVALSGDGRRIAFGGASGRIRIADVPAIKTPDVLGKPAEPNQGPAEAPKQKPAEKIFDEPKS